MNELTVFLSIEQEKKRNRNRYKIVCQRMTHKQKLHASLLDFFLLSPIWRCCCSKSSHKSTRNIADAAFRLARSKYDTCIWLCLLNFKWNFTTVQWRDENEEKNLVNNTSRITLIQIGYIIPQIHRPAPRRSVFSLDFFSSYFF